MQKRRWAAPVLVLALGLVMATAYLPRQSRVHRSAAFAAASLQVGADDPSLAASLALQGYRAHAGNDAIVALGAAAERLAHVTHSSAPIPGYTTALLDADGSPFVITAGSDAVLRVWDRGSGRLLDAFMLARGLVTALAYDSGRGLLAIGEDTGAIRVAELSPVGDLRRPVELTGGTSGPDTSILVIGFFAEGRRLVSVSERGEFEAWRSDIPSVSPEVDSADIRKHRLSGMTVDSPLTAARFTTSPAASRQELIVAADNGTVFAVTLGVGDRLAGDIRVSLVMNSTDHLHGSAQHLAVAPDSEGDQFLIASRDDVVVWSRSQNQVVTPNGLRAVLPDDVSDVTYSVDSSMLQLAGAGGLAVVPTDGPLPARFAPADDRRPYASPLDAVAPMRADGSMAAVTSSNRLIEIAVPSSLITKPSTPPSTVVAHQPSGRLLLANLPAGSTGNRADYLYTVDLSNAPRAATIGAVTQYDSVQTYRSDSSWWSAAPFFVNNAVASERFVAVAGQDPERHGFVGVWDARTATPVRKLSFSIDGPRDVGDAPDLAIVVVLLADDSVLVARNAAGEIAAWSTKDWRQLYRQYLGKGRGPVAVDQYGTTVVLTTSTSGSDDTASRRAEDDDLVALDGRSGRVLWRVPQPEGIRTLAAAPDGRWIAVAGEDEAVRFFDGMGIRHGRPLPSHAPIVALDYSPDGTRLAIADDAGTIRVVDVGAHRRALAPMKTLGGYVPATISWSPDGATLAAAVGRWGNGFIRTERVDLWIVSPDAWAAGLKRVLGDDVMAEQQIVAFGMPRPGPDRC